MKKKNKNTHTTNKQYWDYLVAVEQAAVEIIYYKGSFRSGLKKLKQILDDESERQYQFEEAFRNYIVGYDGERPVTMSEALDTYDYANNRQPYNYTKKPSKKKVKNK